MIKNIKNRIMIHQFNRNVGKNYDFVVVSVCLMLYLHF